MRLRILRVGCKGEDVRVIQKALIRNGAVIDPDGDFGRHTRDAVIAFQQDNGLEVDGDVGPQTRRALFPLVAVTVNVYGIRLTRSSGNSESPLFPKRRDFPGLLPGKLTLGGDPGPNPGLPPLNPPTLRLPPLTPGQPNLVSIPGLAEPIAAPPVAAQRASTSGPDWQQFAQTQRQFTGLFRGPFVDTFAVGIQGVFFRSDDDNHVELTTGCLLQSPIGFQDSQGNNFTIGCFANATWVDPILHLGLFHLANPYAQVQLQGNAGGPVLPTAQLGLFPVNINVDLNDDGLQLNFNGGSVWNLTLDGNRVVSAWGTQLGFGIVGKFRGL